MTSRTIVEKAPREPEDTLAPAPAKGLRGHPWLTLFAVAIGVMMVALDGTIVAIANPAIKDDLDATLAQVQWITNGYLLALAVALITAVATLFLLRPTLLAKVRASKGYRSSLDSIVGSKGRATSMITGHSGEVKVDGQVWEARAFDPDIIIEEGEEVEVFALDGVTLSVYPSNRPLTQ